MQATERTVDIIALRCHYLHAISLISVNDSYEYLEYESQILM